MSYPPMPSAAYVHLRRAARALALGLASLVIAGCGGPIADEAPAATPAPIASDTPVQEPVRPATELAGLYTYTNGTTASEYLGLAIPSTGSSAETEWFAWHRQSADGNPWLYHGFFILSVDGKAQSSSPGITQVKGNSQPSTVSITLTQASRVAFSASVTDNQVSNPTPSSYTAQAVTTGFDFSASALPATIAGDWTGTWFDSGSSFASRTLRVAANGTVSAIALDKCTLELRLQPAVQWNYFRATATLPPQSGCTWTPSSLSEPQTKTLQGIAVIQNRVNGHTQLDMMLLDGTGAGMSYRGTR